MIIEMTSLLEADRHVYEAHRRIRQQRFVIADLERNGKSAHAASALLALMNLTLPIVEDLRQQILNALRSKCGSLVEL
jgi:hypothetical protein